MALAENLTFQISDAARRMPVRRSWGDCIACWLVRCLFAAGVLFWLIGASIVLWPYLPSAQAVIDFVAPTAAQARDAGWVALSEGR